MLRAMSYYSKSYYLKEQSTGLAFYQFLSDILDNYEEKKEDFAKNLKDTIEYVFTHFSFIYIKIFNKICCF